jgi:hypothetical protein
MSIPCGAWSHLAPSHRWRDRAQCAISGRPISFVQELYAPLYLPRPVVKPESYAGRGATRAYLGTTRDCTANAGV